MTQTDISPCDDLAAFIESAESRQAAYRNRRRRWAWKVGRPYSQDTERPAPNELDEPFGDSE